ncbi:hypothetical protein V2J09_014882 [Rumex salicifolius]
MNVIHSGLRFPSRSLPIGTNSFWSGRRRLPFVNAVTVKVATAKPSICTADELHYVSIPGSDWNLALWRYLPPPNVARRNHPLLLLSGVGTNAIGYDLSPPGASFARYMCGEGFDTWTLEVRGAGLSMRGVEGLQAEDLSNYLSKQSVEGLIEAWRSSNIGKEIKQMSQRISNVVQGWESLPPAVLEMHERISSAMEDFQEQVDLLMNNDWDLDEYLKQDLPVVMEYIRNISKPKDDKLLAIGHSMGGIMLYSLLSSCGFEGQDSGLGGVITLGSSLDYSSSKSSLKLILPLAEPAQSLKVRAIPLGAILAAIHPLASQPPYILSWFSSQISSRDMMLPHLVDKLIKKNFCTIPAKLLLQLSTAFQKNGLCDRSGKFTYKDHLHKSNVPIMALAGDQDLICPPEAVYETVKVVPDHLITYKVFGEPGGPHYAHYDIIGSHMAAKEVYPCIIEFLDKHDSV